MPIQRIPSKGVLRTGKGIPSEDQETKEVLAWQTGSRGKKTLKKLLVQSANISCDYYATLFLFFRVPPSLSIF